MVPPWFMRETKSRRTPLTTSARASILRMPRWPANGWRIELDTSDRTTRRPRLWLDRRGRRPSMRGTRVRKRGARDAIRPLPVRDETRPEERAPEERAPEERAPEDAA